MFDLLLYSYYVMAGMRHAGWLVIVSQSLPWLMSIWPAGCAVQDLMRTLTAPAVSQGRPRDLEWPQNDWIQRLTRLESYVLSTS